MAPTFSLADKPLYFVTDRNFTGGRTQLDLIRGALAGGVRLVQYRDKELDDEAFADDACEALALCRAANATLILNDRVDIAKAIGAHGVHLGQDDMDPVEARRVLGLDAVIGLSTHNREEVLAAQGKPLSYINIGPMFPTATKEHSRYPALGMESVLELSRLSAFPCTTMGGIKQDHLWELFSRGITTVAMVTEISLAFDVPAKVRILLEEIHRGREAASTRSA